MRAQHKSLVRCVWMIGRLQSGGVFLADYFARFPVEMSTLRRDVRALRDAGFYVEFDNRSGRYQFICFRAEPEAG